MKKCDICKSTKNVKRYYIFGGKLLCGKHYQQMRNHGRILKRTMYDPNEIIDCGDYYEICLYSGNSEQIEIARTKIDKDDFWRKYKKHQELSRTASAGMFKGGLADAGEQAVKYHTATHLLLAALRQVLGDHVFQKGSNITAERLRFDFSHPQKMTEAEIKKVEEIVNQKIKENLEVSCKEMSLEEAKSKEAVGVFESKYGEKVKVYTIGDFSKEICGGPHVKRTGELGKFKIQKEEASSAGIRRIKANLLQ